MVESPLVDATDAGRSPLPAAAVIFVVALVAAVPLYLVQASSRWFVYDDWDFLAARSLSFHDLMRPHNEHWSTLPIIVYRLLWRFVGLRSYVPYQFVLVLLHLTAAVLLRTIMRRAGVGGWMATVAASLFLFLGSGREDILWAFQIGFVGSLVCGLAHLILADHEGPVDRRDALGIAFGVVGLLCSGVAVTMTVVVGLAVLIRRGWRPAALNTIPLALIYGVWYLTSGHDAYQNAHGSSASTFRFVGAGLRFAFAEMGQLPGVGAALAVVLVVGLIVAWAPLPRTQLRRQAAVPAALLVGGVLFLAIAGYGRSVLGTPAARESRYVHLLAAMSLPAIAVSADALARRWRLLMPALVVLLLVAVCGNIRVIAPKGARGRALGNRQSILELPLSPFARQVPRSRHPASGAPEVTIGWLLDGVHSGRIPRPSVVTPDRLASVTLTLILEQSDEHVQLTACAPVIRPLSLRVQRGDVFVFREAPLAVRLILPDGRLSAPRVYVSNVFLRPGSTTLRVEGGPAMVQVSPAAPARRVVLCHGA